MWHKKLISAMVPTILARRCFLKYPCTLFALVIKEKMKKRILSNPKEVLAILEKGEYIIVNESSNRYSGLNMCYVNDMLGGGIIALGLGYVPCFQVPYYNRENDDERKIIHDDFFEQILCKERKNVYIKARTGLSYSEVFVEEEIKLYAFLYRNLFKLNEKSKNYVEDTYREIRLKADGKILGVCCRGTDFLTLKPKGHPIQPTVEQVIEKVRQFLEKSGYRNIYVTSEEYRIIKIFEEAFPGRILTNEKKYYDELFYENDSITHISQIAFDREDDRYIRGIEYFSSVYILSRCNAIIGGNCGATRSALYMNDLKYEEKYIFDLGLYK